MPNEQRTIESRRRLQNALWGLFIGDALAMPAHWYYELENVQKKETDVVKRRLMLERIIQDNDKHEHNECLECLMPYDQLFFRSLLWKTSRPSVRHIRFRFPGLWERCRFPGGGGFPPCM